jgi:hypothetical protein
MNIIINGINMYEDLVNKGFKIDLHPDGFYIKRGKVTFDITNGKCFNCIFWNTEFSGDFSEGVLVGGVSSETYDDWCMYMVEDNFRITWETPMCEEDTRAKLLVKTVKDLFKDTIKHEVIYNVKDLSCHYFLEV